MVTTSVVARELRQTLEAFSEFGIASFTNTVQETNQRVSWHSHGTADAFLLVRDDLTIGGYLHWLENGHYNAILPDGSLLQVTYDFEGHEIVGHRLAYVPCPVDVTDDESQDLLNEGFPWGDLIRDKLSSVEEVHMKTSIRFDFDPINAALDHPAAHFTMNTVDCRIACATPMRLGRFLDFVFKTFHQDLYNRHEYLRSFPTEGWFEATILQEQRSALHFSWTA